MTLEHAAGLLLMMMAVVLLHYLALILHELGHLVCARAIGWQPVRLAIGVGTPLATRQWGPVKVTFGARFTGGYVGAIAQERAWYRGQNFLFSAAGPAASALFVVGLGWLLARDPRVLRIHPDLESTCLWVLVAECFFLLFNLFPRMIQLDGRALPNDGLSMWRTLFASRHELDQQFALHLAAQVAQLAPQEPAKALALLERVAESFGWGNNLELAKILWLFPHNPDAARAEWRRIEQMERIGDCGPIEILDMLAGIPVFYGLRQLIPEALAAIEKALALDPQRITLRGTKASLLIENGEIEAGERMLEEVCAHSPSENDQAICTYYLALAQKKKGSGEEAVRQLWAAKAKYPKCPVAARIERLILGGEQETS